MRGSQPFSGFGLMEWTAEKARLAKWNGVGCVACRIKVNKQRGCGPPAAMCIYAVHATGSELNPIQSVLAVCSRTSCGTVLTEASADFAYHCANA